MITIAMLVACGAGLRVQIQIFNDTSPAELGGVLDDLLSGLASDKPNAVLASARMLRDIMDEFAVDEYHPTSESHKQELEALCEYIEELGVYVSSGLPGIGKIDRNSAEALYDAHFAGMDDCGHKEMRMAALKWFLTSHNKLRLMRTIIEAVRDADDETAEYELTFLAHLLVECLHYDEEDAATIKSLAQEVLEHSDNDHTVDEMAHVRDECGNWPQYK